MVDGPLMNALNVAQTQPEAVRGMNRGMRQQPAPELMVADARHSVVPVVPPHTLVFRNQMFRTHERVRGNNTLLIDLEQLRLDEMCS